VNQYTDTKFCNQVSFLFIMVVLLIYFDCKMLDIISYYQIVYCVVPLLPSYDVLCSRSWM